MTCCGGCCRRGLGAPGSWRSRLILSRLILSTCCGGCCRRGLGAPGSWRAAPGALALALLSLCTRPRSQAISGEKKKCKKINISTHVQHETRYTRNTHDTNKSLCLCLCLYQYLCLLLFCVYTKHGRHKHIYRRVYQYLCLLHFCIYTKHGRHKHIYEYTEE